MDKKTFDVAAFLKDLTAIPHRAAGHSGEETTLSLLEHHLRMLGVNPIRHEFNAPRTYIPMIWWISGLLLLSLVWPNALTVLVAFVMFLGACLYFDWRHSFLIYLPPQVSATNLWAARGKGPKRLILMAHHDSAPVSYAYKKGQVEHFRTSLILSLLIMAVAVGVAVARALGWAGFSSLLMAVILGGALLVQAFIASFDFWRFGYSNAANDNGTGVAAVLATAQQLWSDVPDDWRIEVLFTGAEEAGMIGALKWLRAQDPAPDPQNCFVLNIDTVGVGKLCYVTQTGTLTTLSYDNRLSAVAETLCADFPDVGKTEHRVADFDSVWFARKGIPSLTLGSYDDAGLMPFLHRPEDRLENVNMACVDQAIHFASALARGVMR